MPTTRRTRSMAGKAIAAASNLLSPLSSTSTSTLATNPDVSNAVTTYDIFHLFPKLPVEIKQSIWLLSDAVPGPKIIWARASSSFRNSFSAWEVYHRSVPKVLHICRETRDEFMDFESGGSGKRNHITWRMVEDLNKSSFKGGIFVSLEKDAVVISRDDHTSMSITSL